MNSKTKISFYISLMFIFLSSLPTLAADFIRDNYNLKSEERLAASVLTFLDTPNSLVPLKKERMRRVPISNSVFSRKENFLFSDDEIKDIELMAKGPVLSPGRNALILADNRHLVGQSDINSSSNSVVNMMLLDHGLLADNILLNSKKALSLEEVASILTSNGLTIAATDAFPNISTALTTHTALVFLSETEIGPHWLIFDHVDIVNRHALVRDPYHEQSVVIETTSLDKRKPKNIIWVKK